MNSPIPPVRSALTPEPALPPSTTGFAIQFTSTPRGARLARLLVTQRLEAWGHPYGSLANETLALITSELASNAVRHGTVPGRDFAVRLAGSADTLRVEVSDTRWERVPLPTGQLPPADEESGRGLLLVSELATRWGAEPRTTGPGKTVWAELRLV